ncbi:uncharacterized protein LOC117141719 isoform X2 [Drosophila mauritiana]|uniref:Uncharacterized protein LOC117141719 isoform X2 n=1 Tax=Drosophila mauritiana TaxID=7226 RepID=A0A6P8JWI4_DROMA|nr:uncharacterized protein LOC117141719 isoform X2 [Drosophila mauritiana]
MSENARHRNSTARGERTGMTSSEMYLNFKRTKLLDKSSRFSLNYVNYHYFPKGKTAQSQLADTQIHDKDEPESRSPTSVNVVFEKVPKINWIIRRSTPKESISTL